MGAVTILDHISVTVSDMERSLEFYCGLLGMEEVERHRLEGDTISRMAGKPKVVMQVVRVKAPDSPRVLLDLQQYVEPAGGVSDAQLGDVAHAHFCFGVPDVWGTYREWQQRGVEFVSEPVTFDLGWGVVHVVFFKDPDGFVLELVQDPIETEERGGGAGMTSQAQPRYGLEGQAAIVTGAGRGIGRAIALRLAREGVSVTIADIDRANAAAVAQEIQAAGGASLAQRADVTQREQVEVMVSATVQHFGRLDILVNNAGIGIVAPLLDTDEAAWDAQMNVNAKGTLLCSQAAARYMIGQGTGGRHHQQRFRRGARSRLARPRRSAPTRPASTPSSA